MKARIYLVDDLLVKSRGNLSRQMWGMAFTPLVERHASFAAPIRI